MLIRPHETFHKLGEVIAYRTGSVKIHKGSLVATDANGWLVRLDPAVPNLRLAGSADESVDHLAAAPGERTCRVTAVGTVCYRPAAGWTPSPADLGRKLYAASDHTVQPTVAGLPNAYEVGRLVALEGPFVRLRLVF